MHYVYGGVLPGNGGPIHGADLYWGKIKLIHCVWATTGLVLEYTGIYICDVWMDECGIAVVENTSVETLGEKQTHRDVVRRVCTRDVQIDWNLPVIKTYNIN